MFRLYEDYQLFRKRKLGMAYWLNRLRLRGLLDGIFVCSSFFLFLLTVKFSQLILQILTWVPFTEKPSFSSNMRTETLGEYGSPITLPCEAVGIPPPVLAWYRNSEPLNVSTGGQYSIQEDGSLLIKKLRMEDTGMFQCLASNEAGEDSIYTWLKVKSKY